MVQAANSIEMLARRNCASILLAYESTSIGKPSTAAASGGGGGSRSHYKCKDCDRTFVTFQALGGHRASHMKLRLTDNTLESAAEEVARPPPVRIFKVHECGQCRDRFPTGQALGGHMRKHAEKRKRADEEDDKNVLEGSEKCADTFGVLTISDNNKKKRMVLQLDLNFPPPVDEPLLQLIWL